MANTKTKTFKIKGNDWLEIFIEKGGKKYCLQFTGKRLNLIENWDEMSNQKTLFTKQLTKERKK